MLIKERTLIFSIKIIRLYKKLINKKEFIISKQLLRSGTSICANVVEAGAAQSKKDFISKMCISSKEARETLYWIYLLKKSNLIDCQELFLDNYIDELQSIINIITKIIKTTQLNLALEAKR